MPRHPRSRVEHSHDTALGQRLAHLRKERGYTQVELAEKVQSMQAVISDYERGRIRPHPAMLGRLAAALQVSADQLLGLKPVHAERPGNRRVLRRLHAIGKLPKRDQQALLRTIDAFLAKAG